MRVADAALVDQAELFDILAPVGDQLGLVGRAGCGEADECGHRRANAFDRARSGVDLLDVDAR